MISALLIGWVGVVFFSYRGAILALQKADQL